MNSAADSHVRSIRWQGEADGMLILIDQTYLPVELKLIECRSVETVWEAIRMLRVRGAPAIGIAAAYGVVLGLQTVTQEGSAAFFAKLEEVVDYLASSRPTAVNLFWALDRMKHLALGHQEKSPHEVLALLLNEAKQIEQEDRQMCLKMGEHGQQLVPDGAGVLTHCNTGGLATADYGTALSVFYCANRSGKKIHVFADETRPLLQGARLTAWELQQWGVPVTVICDSAAAQVMREGKVQAIFTGADRIAANGDAANKIGTYSLAVLAQYHEIPFYVVAPSSTFDLSLADGSQIPIEQRKSEEITHGFGRQTVPTDVEVYNPAFDVTPASLIHGLICEHGLIQPVTPERIAEVLGQTASA